MPLSAFAVVAVLYICFGSECQCSAADDDRTILWRTPIHADGICSLTGRFLQLPDNRPPPIRAWVGLRIDNSGGPARTDIVQRHQQQLAVLRQVSEAELQGPNARNEIGSRLMHSGQLSPRYFDVALIQHAGQSECAYYIDTDLDRRLERVVELDGAATSELRPVPSWLRVELSLADGMCNCTDAGSPAIAPPATVPSPSREVDSNDDVERLSAKLEILDHPAIRKQNLIQIVSVADELIRELERRDTVDMHVLTDAVYRKGRALGYRELPDVLARVPIKDPVALDRAFESTFAKLSELVDIQQPEYVLLAIRRERRRGYRGAALDLLQIYRRRHPTPDWYHKKRSDLIRELELPLAAHQAAADLWLNGKRPHRPVPVIFARKTMAEPDTVTGSWNVDLPWRTTRLIWQSVDGHTDESVVWLPPNRTYTVADQDRSDIRFTTDAKFAPRGVPLQLNDPRLSF